MFGLDLSKSKNLFKIFNTDNKEVKVEYVFDTLIKELLTTGGIIINNGMIRIFGSGSKELNRNLFDVNKDITEHLIVADDVFGGIFSIDIKSKNMKYYAPDTQEWEDMEIDLGQFIWWVFNGDLNMYYESFLWDDFKKEIKNVDSNMAYLFYPFPFTEEFDINTCSKKIIPYKEVHKIYNSIMNSVIE
jgi:hypothetical protein